MASHSSPTPSSATTVTRFRTGNVAIFLALVVVTAIVATIAMTTSRVDPTTGVRASQASAAGGTTVANETSLADAAPSAVPDAPTTVAESARTPPAADTAGPAAAADSSTSSPAPDADTPAATHDGSSVTSDALGTAGAGIDVEALLAQLDDGDFTDADLAQLKTQIDGVVSPAQQEELEQRITALLASPEGAQLQQQLTGILASAQSAGATSDSTGDVSAALTELGL